MITRMNKKPLICITTGEPAGIGPEICLDLVNSPYVDSYNLLLIGDVHLLSKRAELIGKDIDFIIISDPDDFPILKCGQLAVFHIDCPNHDCIGRPLAINASYVLNTLNIAIDLCKKGMSKVIVTAPVNKDVLNHGEISFSGHTEYFAKEFNSPTVMLMTSPNVSVGMVTDHIPLKDVSRSLSKDLIIEKIKILHKTLRRDFGYEKGKIAVLGLNPHAGDKGLIGDEELSIIRPAIVECKNQGIFVFGPYSADGFFGSAQFKKFEAVLALYHDQGLIPFKTIAFSEGVNFTAGLPVVRTSPDHGVGYDIAGQNVADETSFRHALQMAFDVVRNRRSYDEAHNNPIAKRAKNFEDEVLKDEN